MEFFTIKKLKSSSYLRLVAKLGPLPNYPSQLYRSYEACLNRKWSTMALIGGSRDIDIDPQEVKETFQIEKLT
jgi:hypothetical protein